MLKVVTKEIKRKDANAIKKFIKHLNKTCKVKKICKMYLYNDSGFDVFDIENKKYKTPGYYASDPPEIHVCYKRRGLKSILETISHEYTHFLQEIEYGINLSEMADTAHGYFKMELQADKYMRKTVQAFLGGKKK